MSISRYFPSKRIGNFSENLFGEGLFSATGGDVSLANGYVVHTFSYTGADQQLTISQAGSAKKIEIFIWGAAGGGASAEGYSDPGGPGGYAYGEYFVQSIGSIIVQVGQGGGRTSGTSRPPRSYPNAGLPSIRNNYISGAGGGRSAIFTSSVSASNALLVAGGGGGASGHGGGSAWATRGTTGGQGGGLVGGKGRSPYSDDGSETDNGGTQSAGGTTSSGSGNGGAAQFRGADAGNGTPFESGGWNAAGGGGDGWYGGGAIVPNHQGGGGGSGYIGSSITSGVLESTNILDTRYSSSINPPQTGNQYYQTGIGRGNVNGTGGNGLVIIRYLI